jgi:hypothetical protein
MSLWIYKKDKSGKTVLWQIDVAIPFVTVLLGLLLALIASRQSEMLSFIVWFPFALSATGLLLLLISKFSLYRRGILHSFGPGQMTRTYAVLYKAAYVLLGLGVLLILALLRAL